MRFRALTPAFDAVVRVAMRESTFKPALIEQADPHPGHRVLDLGAGTGTLAIMVKRRQPSCEVIGLDADPEILELARRKAAASQTEVSFEQGLSNELPYEDESFDRVVSTLFFHHLPSRDKQATLAEVKRVLRPGGELHLGDYTHAADPVQALLSWQIRVFDGIERTRENFTGELPRVLATAGFADVREQRQLRTIFGTLGLLSARRA